MSIIKHIKANYTTVYNLNLFKLFMWKEWKLQNWQSWKARLGYMYMSLTLWPFDPQHLLVILFLNPPSMLWSMNSHGLNIVAAFRGMHVSPAKHSFGKCDRKVWQMDRQTDGRTDRQTDDGQSDPYVSLCFAGDTKIKGLLLEKKHSGSIPRNACVACET